MKLTFVKHTHGSFVETWQYFSEKNKYSVKLQRNLLCADDSREIHIKPLTSDGPSGYYIFSTKSGFLTYTNGVIFPYKEGVKVSEDIKLAQEIIEHCVERFDEMTNDVLTN